MSERTSGAEGAEKLDTGLISAQMSWMRSDLSNIRTLLSWSRTSVSMIGFGFTIYNFYTGALKDLVELRGDDTARNLGLTLVIAGTLTPLIAIWNYASLNAYLSKSSYALEVPHDLKRRWIYSYIVAGVLFVIGLITLLSMLRIL